MAEIARRSKSLSGSWQGVYRYSWGQTVSFLAQLADAGGVLTGDTVEPRGAGFSFRTASVVGGRSGTRVQFTKIYCEPSLVHRWPIQYSGLLSDDGNTVLGRWLVQGGMGTFAMHRDTAAEEEQAATFEASRRRPSRPLAPVGAHAK